MTKSVASNGHPSNHPRNCKYKPQTASVEGKALVESQAYGLYDRMECLLEQSWDR